MSSQENFMLALAVMLMFAGLLYCLILHWRNQDAIKARAQVHTDYATLDAARDAIVLPILAREEAEAQAARQKALSERCPNCQIRGCQLCYSEPMGAVMNRRKAGE